MKSTNSRRCAAALALTLFASILAAAQTGGYRISSPYEHKNLTSFLIHGKDQKTNGSVITLQEAMERKLFVVYETSEVNELEVENLSKEFDVFVQSGDIVKGGKQDREVADDIVARANPR